LSYLITYLKGEQKIGILLYLGSMLNYWRCFLLSVVGIALLAGCSSEKKADADQESVGFIKYGELKTPTDLPYDIIINEAGPPEKIYFDTLLSTTLSKKATILPANPVQLESYPVDDTLLSLDTIKLKKQKLRLKITKKERAKSPQLKFNAKSNLRSYGQEEGLPGNTVYATCIDQRGNLWIGTNGGLCHFDGSFFTHYGGDDRFENVIMMSILEDHEGDLWIGTSIGILHYDGYDFYQYVNAKDSLGKLRSDGSDSPMIMKIIEDNSHNIWFVSQMHGIFKYDRSQLYYVNADKNIFSSGMIGVVEDENNSVVLISNGLNIRLADTIMVTERIKGQGGGIAGSQLMDSQSNLWQATSKGVVKVNGTTSTYYTAANGFTDKTVTRIFEDHKGILWFTTFQDGVFRYDGTTFTNISTEQGLNDRLTWSVTRDANDHIWIGTNNGLHRYDDGVFDFKPFPEQLNTFHSQELFADSKGILWTAGYNSGIMQLNDTGLVALIHSSYNTTYHFVEDAIGNIWFATTNGLLKYDGKDFWHYGAKQGLKAKRIDHFLQIDEKKMLMVTPQGLVEFDGTHFKHYAYRDKKFKNQPIKHAVHRKDGTFFWVTNKQNLFSWDGKHVNRYNRSHGIPKETITGLYEYGDKLLFINREGLFKLKDNVLYKYLINGEEQTSVLNFIPITDNLFLINTYDAALVCSFENERINVQKQYKRTDGILGNLGTYAKTNNNEIWFGETGQVIKLNLDKVRADIPVTVKLTDLEVASEKIDWNEVKIQLDHSDEFYYGKKELPMHEVSFSKVPKFLNYPVSPEFSHHFNRITFRYSAIALSNAHQLQYRYRLKGVQDDWEITTDNFASFNSIAAGKYTFEVQARAGTDQWGPTMQYEFQVLAPFWETWWFYTLCVLTGMAILYLLFRWRTARLRQQNEQLEVAVKDRTVEVVKQKMVAEEQRDLAKYHQQEAEEQHAIVEERNKEILDSITYAKRIQEAILPPTKLVKEWLPASFILYKPKDIVAGDFYWMEAVEGATIFAAADCTGHGVPGAMVSVVCHTAMNRSVREFGLREPGRILDKTRELVINTFEKSEADVKDGMDIALCSIEGNTLKYAGANNPLWIIRKGEVLETKATKQPIGLVDNPQPFATHTYQLEVGDAVYIFSDGYVDQFGGEKGKKFKARAFRDLLLSIQGLPMEEQRTAIDSAFEKWRGGLEQVDDVCVIGVKI
jgi:ligand-binding sensor domain-containing protein/serine phosphatase RsbU (regulator of sigma subunit)